MTTAVQEVPVAIADETNARILAVSEDQLQGFIENPFEEIARRSGVPLPRVLAHLRAMLEAGTIRRIRQTLMSVNLAPGALVAWQVPEEKLQAAFDWMFYSDPFSGHVVIRSTDAKIDGAKYRLWTTLKVPRGFSMEEHCQILCEKTGAQSFLLMPAKRVFALGVGHVRRSKMEIGSKANEVADAKTTEVVELSDLQWRVLTALKRELSPEEIAPALWENRAEEAGVSYETFVKVARELEAMRVLGRFSTFLEHHKTLSTGERVTKFNALFHWAVPPGRELEAGAQVGRFSIMTHAYWREGGPEFNSVNIMGVAHGTDKTRVLAHKAAIDAHLESCGIPVSYTNVFWGGRSEIKPSEISPVEYEKWLQSQR